MGATVSTFDAMLKEYYIDKVPEAVNQKIILKDHFAKVTDMKVDGRRTVYPIHVGRNVGIGAIAESGLLPTAGNQQYVDMIVPFKFNYGRIQLTAQAMKQAVTSKGAFRKSVDEEIKRAGKDVGRDINRQLFYFGRGDLCHVNGAHTTATVINVNNPGGQAGISYNGARYLRVGDRIAFITLPSTFSAVRTITAVDPTLTNITVDTAISLSGGEVIVRASSASSSTTADTAFNNEVMGLSGMIDDGTYVDTYFGISRTTYPIMKSGRTTVNGSLSLKVIQDSFDLADQLGNGEIKTLFGHHSARTEYLNLLQTFRRYINDNAKSPDGGFKGAALAKDIEYAEKPWKVDRDAPYATIFGIDDAMMNRYVVADAEWAEDDGRVLLRISNQDAYEGRFRIFDNYANDVPNTSFVISDITLSETPQAIQAV